MEFDESKRAIEACFESFAMHLDAAYMIRRILLESDAETCEYLRNIPQEFKNKSFYRAIDTIKANLIRIKKAVDDSLAYLEKASEVDDIE